MRVLRQAAAAAMIAAGTLPAHSQSAPLLQRIGDLKAAECPKAKSPGACRKDFDAYMDLVRRVERTKDQALANRLGPGLQELRAKYQSRK